jgi:hypothetical protein
MMIRQGQQSGVTVSDNPDLNDGEDADCLGAEERAQVERIRADAADAIGLKPRETVKLTGTKGLRSGT